MDLQQQSYIPDDRLAAWGENLARGLRPDGSISARALVRTLRDSLDLLHRRTAAIQTRGPAPGTGEEWLADNWYLAQREGLGACEALARAGRLEAAAGESLLLHLCQELVRETPHVTRSGFKELARKGVRASRGFSGPPHYPLPGFRPFMF